jgi:SNF2 family DNA or RNA helicase
MSIYETVLFDYQKEASKRIQEQRRILLADQPGLGKTLESLAAIELDGLFEKPANILITTPIINAQTTWITTIEQFVKPRYPMVQIIDASKGSAAQKDKRFAAVDPAKVNIIIANHNALDITAGNMRVSEINQLTYDAVIIDESHMVLPINDPRKPTNFWRGLGTIKMQRDALRLAVSGTPDRGKLENRYGTWRFLIPEQIPSSKWAWLEENFFVVEQKVSRTRTIRTTQGLKSKPAWIERDKMMMIRRTKQEVLTQLPAKRYVDVELDLEKEQLAAYHAQQVESSNKMYDARVEERDSSEGMIFALRARQIADCQWSKDGLFTPIVGGKSAKLEWLTEWLNERGFITHDDMADNSAKVVIVSQFSKVLHWLQEELKNVGVIASVLDGSTADSRRVAIQREFQEGALRVVLLSGTMGVGINLDAADDLVMFDSPYDPDRIEQIEDRVHRASNMHQVTIWNLIAADTIDQAIAEKVSDRFKTTRQLLDGARGVEFARRIIEQLTKEN